MIRSLWLKRKIEEKDENNYITYGSYGNGDRPRILGSTDLTEWIQVASETNIWSSVAQVTNPYDYWESQSWFVETDGLELHYANEKAVNENYEPSYYLSGFIAINCDIGYKGRKSGSKAFGLSVRHSTIFTIVDAEVFLFTAMKRPRQ